MHDAASAMRSPSGTTQAMASDRAKMATIKKKNQFTITIKIKHKK